MDDDPTRDYAFTVVVRSNAPAAKAAAIGEEMVRALRDRFGDVTVYREPSPVALEPIIERLAGLLSCKGTSAAFDHVGPTDRRLAREFVAEHWPSWPTGPVGTEVPYVRRGKEAG